MDEALITAHRLRRAVEANGRVTVSVGVAERDWMERPQSLIDRADRQLLQAKREGKNRVSVAPARRRVATA